MRRRYRYNPDTKQIEEVTSDWTDAPRRAQTATEELTYGQLVATDGTPLNTRRKHREYMAAHGLSLASDWTETWSRAERERAEALTGERARRERLEDIGRAYQELRERKR